MLRWLCTFVLLSVVPAFAQPPDTRQMHEEMLYPVVLVTAGSDGGSGTVVYSAKRDNEWHTYILTNFHVVSSAVRIEEEWDSKEQKSIKKERRSPIRVEFFEYNKLSRAIGTRGKAARITTYDRIVDLALVRLMDTERGVEFTAKILPKDALMHLFDEVWAVGAGLGKPPFPTRGNIGTLDALIEGQRYLMSTAPIIFGSSGGALFRFDRERSRYELIGVPSKVSGASFTIVTHMGFSIPAETVRKFLVDNDVGWIEGGSK